MLAPCNPGPLQPPLAQRHHDRQEGIARELRGEVGSLSLSLRVRGTDIGRFLRYQGALLQSLLAPVLPDAAFENGELIEVFLGRTTPEPGLSICSALHARGLLPSNFGVSVSRLPSRLSTGSWG